MILLYIIPMLICLYVAYYIFKDNWDSYIAGGNTECMVMILISFIPFINIVFGFLIGGNFLLTKLKNNKK